MKPDAIRCPFHQRTRTDSRSLEAAQVQEVSNVPNYAILDPFETILLAFGASELANKPVLVTDLGDSSSADKLIINDLCRHISMERPLRGVHSWIHLRRI